MVSLYSIFTFLVFRKIFSQRFLLAGVLIGVLIPDLDIYTYNLPLFYRQPFHSIFTCFSIYLSFLLISELAKNIFYKKMGLSLLIGLIIHISFDILVIPKPTYIFWPLNHINVDGYNIFTDKLCELYLPYLMRFEKHLAISQFIFFRYYAYKLITFTLSRSTNLLPFKFLTLIMKLQTFFTLTLLFLLLIEEAIFNSLYNSFIISSLITFIVCIFMTWKPLINKDLKNGK